MTPPGQSDGERAAQLGARTVGHMMDALADPRFIEAQKQLSAAVVELASLSRELGLNRSEIASSINGAVGGVLGAIL
jgi:hypothetical protein